MAYWLSPRGTALKETLLIPKYRIPLTAQRSYAVGQQAINGTKRQLYFLI